MNINKVKCPFCGKFNEPLVKIPTPILPEDVTKVVIMDGRKCEHCGERFALHLGPVIKK